MVRRVFSEDTGHLSILSVLCGESVKCAGLNIGGGGGVCTSGVPTLV